MGQNKEYSLVIYCVKKKGDHETYYKEMVYQVFYMARPRKYEKVSKSIFKGLKIDDKYVPKTKAYNHQITKQIAKAEPSQSTVGLIKNLEQLIRMGLLISLSLKK